MAPEAAVDIAIIGGGFAGLSAAKALRDGGRDVLVLEAQEQPGGRVKTIRLADGLHYDQGGQFYCRDMVRVCQAVQDHGLTRRDVRKLPGIVAMLGGKRRLLEAEFLEHDFFDKIFQADPHRPGSLLDWVMSLGLGDERVAMIKSGCEEVLGRPIEELSFRTTRDCLGKFKTFENTMEFSCAEGMGTLAGRMAQGLGAAFRASSPVLSVDRQDGLFHLETPGGRIAARQLVYAASPVVLPRIDWKAGQDQWIRQLPQGFVAGKMIKLVLRYDNAFWIGSDFGWLGQLDSPSGLSVMDASDAAGGLDLLAVFCGGTAANVLRGPTEAETLARVLDQIAPLLGPKVRHPIAAVQMDWTDHPWVGGGYATWARPWDGDDPQAALRQPHDGLWFTGSELASEYPGFIEGALCAGQEVAERILACGQAPL